MHRASVGRAPGGTEFALAPAMSSTQSPTGPIPTRKPTGWWVLFQFAFVALILPAIAAVIARLIWE